MNLRLLMEIVRVYVTVQTWINGLFMDLRKLNNLETRKNKLMRAHK